MPTLTPNYVDPLQNVYFHSENGMLGTDDYPRPGEEDPDLINAGKETVTVRKGATFLSSSDAFSMIRGNHLDLSILGALQVSGNGDLANWMIPGKLVKGMGGAMDLVSNVKKIVITMPMLDKHGKMKLKKKVDLPVTGKACVDLLITDKGVFRFQDGQMTLQEISKDTTVEEIRTLTDADF